MGKHTAFQIAVSAIENGEFGPEQDKAIALMNAAPTLYEFVASKAQRGDNEALKIMESIHGSAKRN